jgi:cytochrome d ubiquinol oxidase subunit I
MTLDPLVLSRLQFAWVIAWHILLPALTIGLASYIALLEGIWFVTGKEIWFRISAFWTRIFAIAFGMGVVSGVVMPFQFGTNWSRFSDATANIISPMLAYEGLTAFTLEAGFLGVLLFGRKLVPRWAHFASAILVAAGTLFSTFWILVTNSWMQTPGGYKIVNGIFYPTSWSEIIFSASFPYRFMHTVAAFYVTTGFVVMGVAAYLLRRKQSVDEARLMLSITLWLLTLMVPLQILLGDMQGLNTLHHQPAKLAAIEAHWDHEARAPLTLFAIPDQQAETNHYAIEVPLLGSLILTHDVNGVVPGLKDFPRGDRAPAIIPFFAFRIMVGVGLLMLALVAVGLWLRLRRRLYDSGWFLRGLTWSTPLGFIAVVAGWTTTEVGRQPWTVYGLLRTADSVTPSLTGMDVALSLAGYMIVYLIMYPAGFLLFMRIIKKGPARAEESEKHDKIESGRPRGPVYALPLAGGAEEREARP